VADDRAWIDRVHEREPPDSIILGMAVGGCRSLASCGEPTHDQRPRGGKRGIPVGMLPNESVR
jgi:hypothetical protein